MFNPIIEVIDVPLQILVVDEEEIQRVLTCDCLEEEGFVVTEVADGDATLAEIRRDKPDSVLLNVVMPGRDGFDVCREIRADPEIADIPIIMVTGSEGDEGFPEILCPARG